MYFLKETWVFTKLTTIYKTRRNYVLTLKHLKYQYMCKRNAKQVTKSGFINFLKEPATQKN